MQNTNPPPPINPSAGSCKLKQQRDLTVFKTHLQQLSICCVPYPNKRAFVTCCCQPLAIQTECETYQGAVVGADKLGLLAIIQLYPHLEANTPLISASLRFIPYIQNTRFMRLQWGQLTLQHKAPTSNCTALHCCC